MSGDAKIEFTLLAIQGISKASKICCSNSCEFPVVLVLGFVIVLTS